MPARAMSDVFLFQIPPRAKGKGEEMSDREFESGPYCRKCWDSFDRCACGENEMSDRIHLLEPALAAADIQPDGAGWFTVACLRCNGTAKRQAWSGLGLTRFVPCFDCRGTGRVPLKRKGG